MATTSHSEGVQDQQEQPNILFILSDEHNYRYSGLKNNASEGEPVRTPTLDNLAENGLSFEQSYCSVPLCTPSRISMLTGCHAHNCGAWTNKSVLQPEHTTLPQAFGEAGYETCLVGKMHLGGNRQFCGFNNRPYGDLTGLAGHQDDPIANVEKDVITGPYKIPSGKNKTNIEQRRTSDHMLSRTADAGVTEIPESLLQESNVVQETVSFLREHKNRNLNQPWFMCASLSRPHFPLTAPKRYIDRYWPEGVTKPKVGWEGDTTDHPMIQAMAKQFKRDEISEEQMLRARAAYFASVNYLDEIIGDLLALLDRDGLLDNTIICYASDHGELGGEHGLWWKHSWHEASTRVPWFIRLPAHRNENLESNQIKTPVSLVDLFPTLCGLADVEVPDGLDGVDLSSAIYSGDEPERGPVFCDNLVPRWGKGTEFRMIRNEEYKFVGFRGEPHMLFNLSDDPLEKRNLMKKDGLEEVKDKFKEILESSIDFDKAEAARKEDAANYERYSLSIPKGTGNAYILPDGRLVDAGTPLYKSDVLAEDPSDIFADWPEETQHPLKTVDWWSNGIPRGYPDEQD